MSNEYEALQQTSEATPKAINRPADLKPDILIVDINGLGYAALYTPVGKLSFNGFPTGGIHGALTSLFYRMSQRPGAVPVVTWDRKSHWRHEALPEYKASRHLAPEKAALRASYRMQTPIIQLMLNALGIPQVSCGEAEADDLAGVICRGLPPSWLIELVSRDTDWWQALAENVVWYSPVHKKQMTLADLSDPKTDHKDGNFLSTWEYLQAKALAGDASDEIPGVEKVGLKTATKIMREHGGSIESFWAAIDSGNIKPKGVVIERLANSESREIYARNIKLMDWSKAPALRTDFLALTAGRPDWETAGDIAEEFGLSKVLSRARETLKDWNGWGVALHAVEAALHPQFCRPIEKPGSMHVEDVVFEKF